MRVSSPRLRTLAQVSWHLSAVHASFKGQFQQDLSRICQWNHETSGVQESTPTKSPSDQLILPCRCFWRVSFVWITKYLPWNMGHRFSTEKKRIPSGKHLLSQNLSPIPKKTEAKKSHMIGFFGPNAFHICCVIKTQTVHPPKKMPSKLSPICPMLRKILHLSAWNQHSLNSNSRYKVFRYPSVFSVGSWFLRATWTKTYEFVVVTHPSLKQ